MTQAIMFQQGRTKSAEQRDLERKYPHLMGLCRSGLVAVGPEKCHFILNGRVTCWMPTLDAERWFAEVARQSPGSGSVPH